MMRALVVLALAAAAAAGAGTDSVNLGAGGGEPTPVKDAAKLRAALAKGDPVVELWDDILRRRGCGLRAGKAEGGSGTPYRGVYGRHYRYLDAAAPS